MSEGIKPREFKRRTPTKLEQYFAFGPYDSSQPTFYSLCSKPPGVRTLKEFEANLNEVAQEPKLLYRVLQGLVGHFNQSELATKSQEKWWASISPAVSSVATAFFEYHHNQGPKSLPFDCTDEIFFAFLSTCCQEIEIANEVVGKILSQRSDEFYLAVVESSDSRSVKSIVELIIRAPQNIRMTFIQMLEDIAKDTTQKYPFEMVYALISSNDTELQQVGEAHLTRFFSQAGLSREVLFSIWDKNHQRYAQNIDTLQRLIQLDPSAPLRLFNDCGLACFSRYPLSVLVEVAELLKECSHNPDFRRNQPYVLAVFPRSDWNGAMYSSEVLEDFQVSLQSIGYRVIPIEVASLRELSRLAKILFELLGPASGVLVTGHGDFSLIDFDEDDEITTEHLGRPGMQAYLSKAIKHYLVGQQPTIIIDACGVAKEGGVVQTLSELYRVKVIGEIADTRWAKLEASLQDGELSLHVQYDKGEAHTYLDGQLVNIEQAFEPPQSGWLD